jgi:C-terminal processing protease CtpA/Prc
MKKAVNIGLSLLILSLIFSSCEKVFMKPNPGTDNISIYNEYWKLVDEKYAMWENPDKNLDKEAIHNYTQGLVNENLSEDSLFGVLAYIVLQFKDGHTYLADEKNEREVFYDIEALDDINLDQKVVDSIYLKDDYRTIGSTNYLKYKLLENDQIGYIELRGFGAVYTDPEVDDMLTYFADTKGIVFDIRENGGGDPFMATLFARHFTDKEYYIGDEHFKTGPGPDDFSISKMYLTPAGGVKYTKPVMILTNRLCFSATTLFIYNMTVLPYVKTIGRRTGGGSGSTADYFLANGWYWQMSTSEFIDKDGNHLDNGVDPDINVQLDTLDRSEDEIIERAIQEILDADNLSSVRSHAENPRASYGI